MAKVTPIGRRYWWFQQKKMLRDGVGYTVGSCLRPFGVKWIECTDEPGGLTEIPAGWSPAPWHHQHLKD